MVQQGDFKIYDDMITANRKAGFPQNRRVRTRNEPGIEHLHSATQKSQSSGTEKLQLKGLCNVSITVNTFQQESRLYTS